MRRTAWVGASTLLSLAPCCTPQGGQQGPPASRPSALASTPASLPAYAGPDCAAVLTADARGRAAVAVEITAPTGGWSLKLDSVTPAGTTARVLLTLTSPSRDVAVIQVLQTLTARAELPAGCERVEVLVSSEEEGLQYFKKPDYALAATLDGTHGKGKSKK